MLTTAGFLHHYNQNPTRTTTMKLLNFHVADCLETIQKNPTQKPQIKQRFNTEWVNFIARVDDPTISDYFDKIVF